jgi:hypothetical protein
MKTRSILCLLTVMALGAGKDEEADPSAPYARFAPEPQKFETIPEGTQKLSKKLLELSPKEALKILRDEAAAYRKRPGTTDIAMTGTIPGHYNAYERVVSTAGVGRMFYAGDTREKVALVRSENYKTDIGVQLYQGRNWVSWGGGKPGYTSEGLAFPCDVGGNWGDFFYQRRERDTLIVGNRHGFESFVWIDLKTLTVRAKVLVSNHSSKIYVTHYSGYTYHEGWPFPSPSKGVQEVYNALGDAEPCETHKFQIEVSLEKEARKDFTIPEPPTLDTPGNYSSHPFTYDLAVVDKDSGVMLGKLYGTNIPVPYVGAEKMTPWGKMRFGTSGKIRGWYLAEPMKQVKQ